MPKIISKRTLAPKIDEFIVEAPRIARKHRAGQFILIRLHDHGERIPLTIADSDPAAGTITMISQQVGKTTEELGRMKVGDTILDIAGPLGQPTHIEKVGTVVCVGGGVGTAPMHPIARAFKAAGNRVITILGGRSKDFIIWEDKMRLASHEVRITTDDGSYGDKGLVTKALQDAISESCELDWIEGEREIWGEHLKTRTVGSCNVDMVVAIGPVVMMRAVCEVTKVPGIKTLVSLNPIMVDGTGMCGACRVTVGAHNKFVCVDGPEFDGHHVDFAEMMNRQKTYREEEQVALSRYREECACEEAARAQEGAQ